MANASGKFDFKRQPPKTKPPLRPSGTTPRRAGSLDPAHHEPDGKKKGVTESCRERCFTFIEMAMSLATVHSRALTPQSILLDAARLADPTGLQGGPSGLDRRGRQASRGPSQRRGKTPQQRGRPKSQGRPFTEQHIQQTSTTVRFESTQRKPLSRGQRRRLSRQTAKAHQQREIAAGRGKNQRPPTPPRAPDSRSGSPGSHASANASAGVGGALQWDTENTAKPDGLCDPSTGAPIRASTPDRALSNWNANNSGPAVPELEFDLFGPNMSPSSADVSVGSAASAGEAENNITRM